MSLTTIFPGFSRLPLAWETPHLFTYLRYFDSHFYRTHDHVKGSADLAHLSHHEALRHFIFQGWRNRRSYSAFLYAFCEPDFYLRAYPELDLPTKAAAIQHWMYEGIVEGRSPNSVTHDLLRATTHVFNMGKCGSRTVVEAVEAACPGPLVVHAHSAVDFARSYPNCFWSYPELIARAPGPLRFIAGVRDPFSRVVSGYLQEHEADITNGTLVFTADLVPVMLAEMTTALPYVVGWFDHGFYCGIDAYATPFDGEHGFVVCGSGDQQAFVYRLSALSRLAEPLGRFLEHGVQFTPQNIAAEKGPAMAVFQEETLRHVRFPAPLVEETLATRFVRQFFTAAEIAHLRDRWTA